jgi:hypothetical protein
VVIFLVSTPTELTWQNTTECDLATDLFRWNLNEDLVGINKVATLDAYKAVPQLRVVKHGPALGKYMDKDIPEWIETADGKKHEYSRILSSNEFHKLPPNESVISPGLVYRASN